MNNELTTRHRLCNESSIQIIKLIKKLELSEKNNQKQLKYHKRIIYLLLLLLLILTVVIFLLFFYYHPH